jgi:predicted transcriptional regulator
MSPWISVRKKVSGMLKKPYKSWITKVATIAQFALGIDMGKLEEVVIEALKGSEKGLTLVEIAGKIGQPEKKVFRELRSLFEKGIVDTENRRYKLVKG